METTKEITLQTIAELIEKNQKIANGLDAFLAETESERERLLAAAHAKLESYFMQVLDLMPFSKLNVQIDSDTDIFLRTACFGLYLVRLRDNCRHLSQTAFLCGSERTGRHVLGR